MKIFNLQSSIFNFQSLILVCVLFAAPIASAQTTGLSFLKIGPSAAGLAMGDALTAHAHGAFAIYYNPAGLARPSSNVVAASHTSWVGTTRTYNAAAQFAAGDYSAWGAAVTAVSSGDIEARRGPSVEPDGLISAQFVNISVGYGRQFGPVRVGGAVKYLSERIAAASASGYAFDLGIQVPLLDDHLQLGAAVQHIGRMEKLDTQATPLPLTIRGGVAVYPFEVITQEDGEPLLTTVVTAELVHRPADNQTQFQTGLAAQIFEMLVVRAGYLSGDLLRSFSFGGGLTIESLRFDYAYLPFESGFGAAGHVITLAYLW